MNDFLELMNQNATFWFCIGLFLTILEVMLGSFFLIWIGGAAFLVAILKYFMPNLLWQPQMLIFSAISVFSIFLWKKYFKPRNKAK